MLIVDIIVIIQGFIQRLYHILGFNPAPAPQKENIWGEL